MPKQIMVFLNSPHVKSALVDVPDACELSTWITETKTRDYFISKDDQLWVYSAISGATIIEAVAGTTAVQAMQAMESRRR
jgi:hypothetical protein